MTSSTDKKQDQKIKQIEKELADARANNDQAKAEFLRRKFNEIQYGNPDGPTPIDPEPKPTPQPSNGNFTKDGVQIPIQILEGGVEISNVTVERSIHDQSNEKNIQRDSIYASPSKYGSDTVNFATFGYLRFNLTKPDGAVFKRLGGDHTDNAKKQGKCYGIGLQINPGKNATPLLEKEYPEHSTTPKFSQKATSVMQNIPDLNGKTFGIITIGYKTPQNTYKIECWIDTSVLDTPLEQLIAPPNNWVKAYESEDKGDWVGEVYLQNNGVLNGGKAVMLYGRIDHVSIDSSNSKKPTTETKYCGAIEIVPRS